MARVWRPFGAGVVNLLTVEAVVRQGLVERLVRSSRNTILTTVHHDSPTRYSREIKQLGDCPHVRIVPHYAPLLQEL